MNKPAKPLIDHRPDQAERAAAFLELKPESTAKEIDAATDCGCITKLLSEMEKRMGYGIGKGWRYVACISGARRRVRTYSLLYRPSAYPDLFEDA
ncbi:MAG: hypothetical protein ACK4F6_16915 [Hylemonella sp.]